MSTDSGRRPTAQHQGIRYRQVPAVSSYHDRPQDWNYKSYIKDRSQRHPTISLKDEKDGKATFRMITSANRPDKCIAAGDLPAEVERSAETLTITVLPPLTGCEPFRYVIKNDGSGGVRLSRRNDQWVPDGFDHDLTPKK